MSKSKAETTAPYIPAMNPVSRKLADLKMNPDNVKEHPDSQVEQIRRSIREFGWTIPILVDEDDNVIAGHGRIMAGLREGITEAPCIVAKGWSEDQKLAYLVADNKLTENAVWDIGKLGRVFQQLDVAKFDLSLTGFEMDEVTSILAEKTSLTQRVETIAPIHMTHVLISIPVNAGTSFLDDAIARAKELGGRVEYGGNSG